ncbi:MAG: ECF transporter S component [Clostridia bacterium]|jgi:riboflavin transporter FmnP|nr:ECF transporter S component [Clostridia bacterium]
MLQVRQMVRVAMLSAIGIILFYFVAFPLPFFPEFLTYDAGDIPGMVAAFVMGPWLAVLIQFLKAFLGLLIGASKAGWIGATANFIAGGTMVLVSGLIYARHKSKGNAIISLIAGSLVTAGVMGAVNYYWLFPLWGIPQNQLMPMLVGATLPFNFVKFIISSIVTFLLYKKVRHLL